MLSKGIDANLDFQSLNNSDVIDFMSNTDVLSGTAEEGYQMQHESHTSSLASSASNNYLSSYKEEILHLEDYLSIEKTPKVV